MDVDMVGSDVVGNVYVFFWCVCVCVCVSVTGEAWGLIAHCHLMTDELEKAYRAYYKSLSYLTTVKDPNLWYGIGILYDRYGSLDLALAALSEAIKLAPDFDRANEVYFCVGIIYKEKQDYPHAIEYFNRVIRGETPLGPVSKKLDALLQLGHVYELQNDIDSAMATYRMCSEENPDSTRTLQQYAWLTHQRGNTDEALNILERVIEHSPTDPHAFYLKARIDMDREEHQLAYDALNKAISFDNRNPFYWCSIGVLYNQMAQYRDAMDAYSQAIHVNQFVYEVWFNLGVLYEIYGQLSDSLGAYRKAADLVPDNIKVREALEAAEELQQRPGSANAAREGERPKSLLPPTNPFATVLRAPQQQHQAQIQSKLQQEGIDLTSLAARALNRGNGTANDSVAPSAVRGDTDALNPPGHPQQPGWTHTSVTLDSRGGYSLMPSSLQQPSIDH